VFATAAVLRLYSAATTASTLHPMTATAKVLVVFISILSGVRVSVFLPSTLPEAWRRTVKREAPT
jgi:hypothetical protein